MDSNHSSLWRPTSLNTGMRKFESSQSHEKRGQTTDPRKLAATVEAVRAVHPATTTHRNKARLFATRGGIVYGIMARNVPVKSSILPLGFPCLTCFCTIPTGNLTGFSRARFK